MSIAPPPPAEYSETVAHYVQAVPAGDVFAICAAQLQQLSALVAGLIDEQALVHHPPYTWSIKQVVGHMTDCERVFGYRALRLARGDATPLPGFDESAYMASADFDRWPINELLTEFEQLRRSHIVMLRHLTADAWLHRGVVNNYPITARASVWVMTGHAQHHLNILHKRLSGRA